MEKLDYLIDYLIKENQNIKLKNIPKAEQEKKDLFRSLCNIRDPKEISEDFLKVQDEYLREELNKKMLTDIKDIEPVSKTIDDWNIEYQDKICLWKGDITSLKIEAIVNAANSQGLGCFVPCHKCIDNQIHSFAGIQLRIECNKIMKEKEYYLPTGEAFITNGYNLPSEYVIHTVGPIVYTQVTEKEKLDLVNTYINCLILAKERKINTIAFPCISTGEFKFPKELAVKCAILAIQRFLKENKNSFEKIVFNVFSEEDYKIYERYIKQNKEN